MSWNRVILTGICPSGKLSWLGFVLVGSWLGGDLSWELSWWGAAILVRTRLDGELSWRVIVLVGSGLSEELSRDRVESGPSGELSWWGVTRVGIVLVESCPVAVVLEPYMTCKQPGPLRIAIVWKLDNMSWTMSREPFNVVLIAVVWMLDSMSWTMSR